MFKHLSFKHFKKKHHPKKDGHEMGAEKHEDPVFHLVNFGLAIFGWFLILVPILFGVWALGNFEIKYHDRFYPGVFVGGQPVGGQTYAEALNHFAGLAKELETNGLKANFESSKEVRKVNIPMSTTGLTPDNSVEYFTLGDWKNDLQKAYRWGHGLNLFRSLTEQLVLLFVNKKFVFSATIQKEAVDSLLSNELYGFYKESVPAEFLSNKNIISISKEKFGESINREEVLDVLKKKVSRLDITPATFKAHIDTPKVTEMDLAPFLDFTQSFAKKTNLVLQYQGRTWQIKGPKLVTWFTIKKVNGKEKGQISIDHAKLENYLTDTVAKFIDNPPRNSRFEIRNGKLVEIVSGKAGFIVDIDKTIQKIEKIIPEVEKALTSEGDLNLLPALVLEAINPEVNFDTKNSTIYLPIETKLVEPKITKATIEKYFIKDLVGEIRTNFAGSTANREHNIKIGVAAITGMLIPPGAEFSTVSSIGPVSGKEGYVKELVIKENRTTKEFGGGLCQVATTLFRLALSAGLPITERVNHRFVVPYYNPPGLDATIYGPHPDLRFVNDTSNYLLLQARVENKQVIMELYGQKDGRTVEISQPRLYNKIPAPETKYVQNAELPVGTTQCFETPHDGITTDVLYTVRYPHGAVKEKNFHSIYQPWQKICLVGPTLPNPPLGL